MKNFTKTLVAATLALGTVSANAAIDNSGAMSSEAFLSVYGENADASAKATFTMDLGVSLGDLIANRTNAAFALTFDLAALSDWNSFKAKIGNDFSATKYLVATGGTSGTGIPSVATTSANPVVLNGDFTDFGSIQDTVTSINGHALTINGDADDSDFANNNTTFGFFGDGVSAGLHNTDANSANNLWEGPIGVNPEIAYGSDAEFYLAAINGATFGGEVFSFENKFLLADDALTFGATPSAVPVPAAVWLFGSALLGMAGIRRRNVTAA